MASQIQQPSSANSFYGKKNWKKWVWIYFLIGLVIYAGIYYLILSKQVTKPYSTNYSTPTPQPTIVAQPTTTQEQTIDMSNWKTYISTKSGIPKFSLKYPSQWQYSIEETDFSNTLQKNRPSTMIHFGELETKNHIGQTVAPYVAPAVTIFLTEGTDIASINIETLYNIGGDSGQRNVKNITLNGIPAKQITHLGCVSGDCMNTVFKKNNILFDLGMEVQSDQENLNVFNQILSTFRFLE